MLQKLLMVIFGLLTFMLLARVFKSPEKFGIWGLFIIISSIVEMLRHALIKNGYILFINTCEEKELPGIEFAAVLSNCLFSLFLIIFFFSMGGLMEKLFNSPGMETILKYYSCTLLFLIIFSQREFFLIARTDFKGIFFMYFIRNGLFMLVAAYFFFSGKMVSPETLAIYYGASTLGGIAIGMLPGKKHARISMKWNKKIFIRFINYGRFILGTNFFALIFRNTDSFTTARFISPVAVAFYNTSTRIINFAEMPVLVLSETMLPRAAQIIKSGDLSGMKNIYEKTVAATLTFIIPFIIITSLFAKYMIVILAGRHYLEATGILHIMVFYCLFLPFISQFGNIMDATNRPHVNFRVMMIFAGLNILSNIFFIKQFGLLGAAYGTLFSYFILFITTQIILTRLVGISQIQIIRNIFVFYPDYVKIAKRSLSKYFKPVLDNNEHKSC